MKAVLAYLITRFRAAQDRGVAALIEQLGVPLPTSQSHWIAICGTYGLSQVRSLKGIGVYAHGYGIELIFDNVTIDFDFGDAGEADGFDTWRLWNFVRVNELDVVCEGYSQVDSWLEQAHQCGELTRDSHLYYSPAHRAPERVQPAEDFVRPGTWTVRLCPEAAPAELQALAALLRDELQAGLLTHVDPVALEALNAGVFPPAGASFTLCVSEAPHLQLRVRFVRALPATGAVESVFGARGAPLSMAAREIKTAERWLASDDPNAMLLGRWQTVSFRKRRLFGCACCRHAWDALTDERSRQAVVVAEAFADGAADAAELRAAHDAANAAVRDVPREPLDSPQSLVCNAAASAANAMNASIAVSNALVEAAEGEPAKVATRPHGALLRDLVGNPFRPVAVQPFWLTATVLSVARGIYEDRAYDLLPILADTLQDAGCDNADVLDHCRAPGPRVRGCWVVDLLLAKE